MNGDANRIEDRKHTLFSKAHLTSSSKSEPEISETLETLEPVLVPPFPGQTKICWTSSDWASFQANACSLPPLPSTRIRSDIVLKNESSVS